MYFVIPFSCNIQRIKLPTLINYFILGQAFLFTHFGLGCLAITSCKSSKIINDCIPYFCYSDFSHGT